MLSCSVKDSSRITMHFEKVTRPRAHQCSLRVQSRTSGHHRPAIAGNVFALDTQKPCVCSPGRQGITDLLLQETSSR